MEQFLAERGTLLQPGKTLRDLMPIGYVYLILADKVTWDFLKTAMEAYEAQDRRLCPNKGKEGKSYGKKGARKDDECEEEAC